MSELEGKTALISGGSRGIGASIASLFLDEGANVLITDILEEEGNKTVENLSDKKGDISFISHDVTNEGSWNDAVSSCIKEFGGLNILINNAGIYSSSTVEETSIEEWKSMFTVNVEGVFLGTKAVLDEMKKSSLDNDSGSIINLSSIAGLVGSAGHGAYTASKGAVKLFTKSCAIEFAELDYNIRVNSIHPGVIETKMGAQVVSNLSENLELGDNEAKEMTALMHPVKRMGVPEEIAQLALFLASNRSSFITGAEMVIDGGFTAK
tara:strand:+ start:5073 stop:5870 length:798 start_codon:yes stop_codon:yes gene_type:complete